ncbi:MAG: hypothetical protein ACRDN6_12855 [Gaiellaceae bacterium]
MAKAPRKLKASSTVSFAQAVKEEVQKYDQSDSGSKQARFRVAEMYVDVTFKSPGVVDVYLVELEQV